MLAQLPFRHDFCPNLNVPARLSLMFQVAQVGFLAGIAFAMPAFLSGLKTTIEGTLTPLEHQPRQEKIGNEDSE
jgi:hypothetical protein